MQGHHKYAFEKDLNKGSYGFVQASGSSAALPASAECRPQSITHALPVHS